jgi:hypothetical protein
MKIILIAWFITSGDTSGTSLSVEFDSRQACENAGLALQEAGSKGAGKNVKWRYICTPAE